MFPASNCPHLHTWTLRLGNQLTIPWNLYDEQLPCGDETSVQAHFQAQVGHITSTIKLLLGNYRRNIRILHTDDLGGIPDIVCLKLRENTS